MVNEEIADIFEKMSRLLAFKGANRFRALAYERAARSLRVARKSYDAALQYFTGSKQHNIHLRTLAQRKGLKINEYVVFRGVKRLGGADAR
jgi:DNA polymerase (family 10)